MAATELIFEPLGDDSWAVFHAGYWDSTVLRELDYQLLQVALAAGQPMDEDDLVATLASTLEIDLDTPLNAYCRECLRQMAHVGLIHEV